MKKCGRRKKCQVIKKLILAGDVFLLFRVCFLILCLFLIIQSQQFFHFSGGTHTMDDTDCFIFSACTPLLRLLLQNRRICQTWGGNAEPAEYEHFLSNNWKSCWVERGAGGLTRCRERGSCSCKVPDHQVWSG